MLAGPATARVSPRIGPIHAEKGSRIRRKRLELANLLALALVVGFPSALHAEPEAIKSSGAIAALERAADGRAVVRRSAVTGAATFVRTGGGPLIESGEAATAPAERRARAFLSRHGEALGVRDPVALTTIRVTPADDVGMEHVFLQQMHRGVRVRGAELGVHLRGAGVAAANGHVLTDLSGFDTAPSLAATTARAIAASIATQSYGAVDPTFEPAQLELFNRGLFDGTRAPTRLAWFIEATGAGLRAQIWVDAHSGEVLLHFNAVPAALNRLTYDAMHLDPPGTLMRSEGEPPTGDSLVDDAYDFSGDTYDYFFSEHGRDSYDGSGSPMEASVRICSWILCLENCPCFNAFWFLNRAVFGDLFVVDDVVAHEFTHGVTEYSANLNYLNQPGALNESFSDIFGESVDLTNGAGTDTPEVRWRHAEDIFPSGFRNMMEPTLLGSPGKLTDPELECSSADNGGVHTNSGVGNHAYALAVDGGSYNGHTISGIGLAKAGKIAYRTLTAYLTSSSTYQDNYDATQQSCADLVGTAGITSADCAEVTKALDAVEMYLPWPCNCGNGSLDVGEGCDDGNHEAGDGCDPFCLVEPVAVPALPGYGWLILGGAIGLVSLGATRRRARGAGGGKTRPAARRAATFPGA